MPRTGKFSVGRFVVYAALGFGAIVFGFPLFWMLVTSLTPAEQTLAYPPQVVPVAHYAMLDGQRMEVTRDYEVRVRSAFVETLTGLRAGVRYVVPLESYNASDPWMRLIKVVEPGWWQVTQRSASSKSVEKDLKRDVLPQEMIETRPKLRWENYPKALLAMGGRSLEEIEGFVDERQGPRTRDAEVSFLTFLSNTLIVCVLGVIGTVLSNSIIAYGFARLQWPGRDAFFAVTLATMMIPFPVLMVPTFGIFQKLGWIGTLLPLWAPMFFGSAFHIFLMRQFFRTIPEELSEAARIDGCSEWRIFWRIILPLSRPVLAVSALFHFLFAWNDFLAPLIYLTRKHTFTLPLALQAYQSTHGSVQWNFLMAASAVTVIPIIVLFFFTQKTFIQGIATTGSKN
jgi:multiple sugar transport system permease protein